MNIGVKIINKMLTNKMNSIGKQLYNNYIPQPNRFIPEMPD